MTGMDDDVVHRPIICLGCDREQKPVYDRFAAHVFSGGVLVEPDSLDKPSSASTNGGETT